MADFVLNSQSNNKTRRPERPSSTLKKNGNSQGTKANDPSVVAGAAFPQLHRTASVESTERKIELLLDVSLPVSIELGRTSMYIKDILELHPGSIIELEKMAGEPVDLYVNDKKMAEGEVVVVDNHFGIRITDLINPDNRIENLGKVES